MGNASSSLRSNGSDTDQGEITPESPASNLSSITTSCSTEPQQEAEALTPLIYRVSKSVPSSNTISFAYDYGRRLGAKNAKMAAEKNYADLSATVFAEQKRDLEQQKRDLDRERKAVDVQKKDLDQQKQRHEIEKVAHEGELANQNAVSRRQIESARSATLKLQTTLEEEGHKSHEKLKAVTIRHTEEKKKIRAECERTIAQLQADLNNLNAQRDQEDRVNNQEWGPAGRHGDAHLDELRGHVLALEERLQSTEAELNMTQITLAAQSQAWRSCTNKLEPTATDDQGTSQLLKEHKDKLQQLEATTAWLTVLMRGLHFSLSNQARERQLEVVKATIARAAAALAPPMAPLCPFPLPPDYASQVSAQGSSATPLSDFQQSYPLTGYRASSDTTSRPSPPPDLHGGSQQMPSGHTGSNPVSNAWARHEMPMSQ
ncbi:MAG: hypothetical protein LQ352_004774 [Teloschistes flavicans]|nr:MAG: hypothetical protein LQ352_004774 [Teloschistes flavicans]